MKYTNFFVRVSRIAYFTCCAVHQAVAKNSSCSPMRQGFERSCASTSSMSGGSWPPASAVTCAQNGAGSSSTGASVLTSRIGMPCAASRATNASTVLGPPDMWRIPRPGNRTLRRGVAASVGSSTVFKRAEPGQQPRRRYVAVAAPRGGAAHCRNRLCLRHLAEPASFVRSGQRVMLEGIESRIAHVRVDLEVAGWIEFRARPSAFGRTEANVVSERREARGGNVWIGEQVVSGVERGVHPMALAPAIQHVVHKRIQSGGADVRIATQVVHRVEQRRGPSPLARAAR